jgi:hypothetical protein
VSISYALPTRLLTNIPIKDLRIAISGRNLFLFTPSSNKDFDPEVAVTTGANGLIPGFGNMSIPSTKAVEFSFNLKF